MSPELLSPEQDNITHVERNGKDPAVLTRFVFKHDDGR